MLFISEYESFGNVVVESILCGTPVVVSDIPSFREIFENFPEFLLTSPESLEESVIKKINQLDHLNYLVPKAKEEFSRRFSFEKHINRLKAIYASFS